MYIKLFEEFNHKPELYDIKDGEYSGTIKGYKVKLDKNNFTFKTTTGIKNAFPINCNVIVSGNHAIVYFKDGILFSDEDIMKKWKDKYNTLSKDPNFQRLNK
jgi:hypothetical protein